jgi:hypothetical protein
MKNTFQRGGGAGRLTDRSKPIIISIVKVQFLTFQNATLLRRETTNIFNIVFGLYPLDDFICN